VAFRGSRVRASITCRRRNRPAPGFSSFFLNYHNGLRTSLLRTPAKATSFSGCNWLAVETASSLQSEWPELHSIAIQHLRLAPNWFLLASPHCPRLSLFNRYLSKPYFCSRSIQGHKDTPDHVWLDCESLYERRPDWQDHSYFPRSKWKF